MRRDYTDRFITMHLPDINEVMQRVEPYLDIWDQVLRHGHDVYQGYPAEVVLEHDVSAQAHCTNRHILAEAHRVFAELPGVLHFEVRRQSLWLFEQANAVVRLKKTDEDGVSSNYPTEQAKAFDRGEDLPGLPGLPSGPTRLTVGYLLDMTGSEYIRSQVSLPIGGGVGWCAAIVPFAMRSEDEAAWHEVTRQPRIA
ncbi:hypothetical protein [Pelagibius sp.]|uniref:hypothetical protein n=1 Tax=Pelagibius sp. TaxID=1931238 RepID=UPI0026078CA4|nr:hypothetical protein [Pelagibius sp.]